MEPSFTTSIIVLILTLVLEEAIIEWSYVKDLSKKTNLEQSGKVIKVKAESRELL